MKITAVTATPLAVPFKETVLTSHGEYSYKSTVLIEITTDEGIVGLGEAPGIPLPEITALVIEEFAAVLVGSDPLAINNFRESARGFQTRRTGTSWIKYPEITCPPLAGIEIALWDIIGKKTAQPLYKLLGGKVRNAVDMFAWIRRKDRQAMIADALQFKDEGFKVFYTKVGLGTRRDRDDLAALRKALGSLAIIRIDANGAWPTEQAIQEIRGLQDIGLDWVEQPVPEDDFAGFEVVKQSVTVPLCIDQGARTPALIRKAIRRRLADVICCDAFRAGGLLSFRELANEAQSAGMNICLHAGAEFGISATAHLHVMATIPNATLGNQTYATTITEDIVYEPTTHFHGGTLIVPDRPGLGITLNRTAVRKYAELYRTIR